MSRGGFLRRFPVLGIRDFRLLLTDRLIAPASVGFSIVGVSFAVLKATNSAADLSYVLAAQMRSHGIRTICTYNVRDFDVIGIRAIEPAQALAVYA